MSTMNALPPPHQTAGSGTPTLEAPPLPVFPSTDYIDPLPTTLDNIAPSLCSNWSGFTDDFEDTLLQSSSTVVQTPTMAALNPSQKRACLPDPNPLDENDNTSHSPTVSDGSGLPGFTAEQVASLKLLFQSCLPGPPLPTPPDSSDFAGYRRCLASASIASSVITLPPQPLSLYDDPQPDPSWDYDPPVVGPLSEVVSSFELVDFSDTEDGDSTTTPVVSLLL